MRPESKTSKWLYSHIGYVRAECLHWPYGRDSQGYARAKVVGFSTRLAHRIMCEMAHGPAPFDGAVARHLCGRGHAGCINPNHLAWSSVAENNADKEAHGTKPIGESVGISVLDPERVRSIRSLYASGASQRSIAAALGVCHTTIQAVVERRTWGHVE